MTDKRQSVDLHRSMSHRTGKYFSAGALAGTDAPCPEKQAGLNPAHPIYTAAHWDLQLQIHIYTHFLFFSHMSSLQIFASYHSKRLIPPVPIGSNLVRLCPQSSRQKKADSLWAGNRSRLTSVVVCSGFLICNWQVVRFHKSLYSLPVIQCYTKGHFRIDLAFISSYRLGTRDFSAHCLKRCKGRISVTLKPFILGRIKVTYGGSKWRNKQKRPTAWISQTKCILFHTVALCWTSFSHYKLYK